MGTLHFPYDTARKENGEKRPYEGKLRFPWKGMSRRKKCERRLCVEEKLETHIHDVVGNGVFEGLPGLGATGDEVEPL